MFKSPEKMLNNIATKSAMRKNEPLSENEISLEGLRHNIKNLNINTTIKATQYSIESNIPLSVILSVGEPQYSTEGFLGEIGKSIKNKFEKVGLWFKTNKNHEMAVKILSTLKPEVTAIINSATPNAINKKLVADKLEDMVARASKAIVVGADISKENLPGFIKRILNRVAEAGEYLNSDENMSLALSLFAPGYKKIMTNAMRIFASDEEITAAYKLLTGTDKLPEKASTPEYVKELIDKLSKKSNGAKILIEAFTNPTSMKGLLDTVQGDAKALIETGKAEQTTKEGKYKHNSEIMQKMKIINMVTTKFYQGLYHITVIAADISRV